MKEEDDSVTEQEVRDFCANLKPNRILLAFKKEIDKPLIIETRYPLPEHGEVYVMITDISRDWQLPLAGTKDIGNPKIKGMSLEDFHKTFDIISYWGNCRSNTIMKWIDKLGLGLREFEGKPMRISY